MDLHVLRGTRIVPVTAPDGEAFAYWDPANPLGPWSPSAPAARVVIWSGWLDDDAAGVRTWGRAGREAFEALCDRIAEGARGRVLVRPNARHVLSDIPSCADFLRRRAGGPIGLLLDPASMLTGSMLAAGAEHVARILGAIAPMPGVEAVLLANVARAEDHGEAPRLEPLTRGELDARAVAASARAVIPRGLPVVQLDDDLAAQGALLV